MNILKKWESFLNENSEIIEFPLKKFLSIIKNNLVVSNKGISKYEFDFLQEIKFKCRFTLIINWIEDSAGTYFGNVNEDDILNNKFDGFKLNVNIKDIDINYHKLLSTIQHELKHTYDLYWDINRESFDKVIQYNILRRKYSNNKILLHFIELSNLSLKHELEARNNMIYDRLRWLKTYDVYQLSDEFKNTYVYKALIMLSEFNHNLLINNVNYEDLLIFTNDFLNNFLKSDKVISDKKYLIDFYKNCEDKFHQISKNYIDKAHLVIDELVKDKKPYMENLMSNLDFHKVSEKFIDNIKNDIFK